VLVETLVLFAGVVSRLMRRPLTWSDEFASILFLWLAMLGAVIALYRGEHMRLTTFVAWSPAPLRRLLDALAWVVPMVFLAWMLPYAIEQTLSDWVVSTPSLEWSGATKIAAIPVGFVLMIVLSVIRMIETVRWSDFAVAAILVLAVGIACWLGGCDTCYAQIGEPLRHAPAFGGERCVRNRTVGVNERGRGAAGCFVSREKFGEGKCHAGPLNNFSDRDYRHARAGGHPEFVLFPGFPPARERQSVFFVSTRRECWRP